MEPPFTLPFEKFWNWLVTHPNCILRAGTPEAVLYDDAIRLTGSDADRTVPLESIQYADVERNYKLQLWLADEMVQLSFTKNGSALQWHNTLHRLL